VWVNQQEIAELARAVSEPDLEKFERDYVREVGVRKSLKEYDNGDCVFFDGERRLCRVYEARPRQCRTWPFWDSNLKTPEDWQRTCQVCPGSGNGKLYVVQEIESQRQLIKV
jgi:Fe-S-cluster containining protein